MTDCLTCRHAFPATSPDGKIDFSRKICKAGPPTPILIPNGNGGAAVQGFFPTVGKGIWCSRHDDPTKNGWLEPTARELLTKVGCEGWDEEDVSIVIDTFVKMLRA